MSDFEPQQEKEYAESKQQEFAEAELEQLEQQQEFTEAELERQDFTETEQGQQGEQDQHGQDEHGSEKSRKQKIKSALIELVAYVLILAACVTVIPNFVLQRTIVSGHSMEDTLQDGNNLLVEKVSYHFVNPKRFDIVMFYPYGKEAKEYYVKRVIALPGETIQIKGEDIYINGDLLEEDYGKDPIDYSGIADTPLTLGEDEFFLMGDNREVSLDSRYEEVGPVHKKLISGKALVRIWPLSEFGTVE